VKLSDGYVQVDTGVQKRRKVNKYYGDEVVKLGGLFTNGLRTAAAIADVQSWRGK
jgi:hypothetical protein